MQARTQIPMAPPCARKCASGHRRQRARHRCVAHWRGPACARPAQRRHRCLGQPCCPRCRGARGQHCCSGCRRPCVGEQERADRARELFAACVAAMRHPILRLSARVPFGRSAPFTDRRARTRLGLKPLYPIYIYARRRCQTIFGFGPTAFLRFIFIYRGCAAQWPAQPSSFCK